MDFRLVSGNFSGVIWSIVSSEQNFCTIVFFVFITIDFLKLSRIKLETFCVLGRRVNRYTTAPDLAQVASFSCFVDLEFYSSVQLSKMTENFACLNGFSSGVRQFFWSYLKYSFQRTKFLYNRFFRFHNNWFPEIVQDQTGDFLCVRQTR